MSVNSWTSMRPELDYSQLIEDWMMNTAMRSTYCIKPPLDSDEFNHLKLIIWIKVHFQQTWVCCGKGCSLNISTPGMSGIHWSSIVPTVALLHGIDWKEKTPFRTYILLCVVPFAGLLLSCLYKREASSHATTFYVSYSLAPGSHEMDLTPPIVTA